MAEIKDLQKKKRKPVDVADLVPVYVPSLYEILAAAEKKKGAPLTEDEVLSVRDTATVVMMRREAAGELSRSRTEPDIDPADCWAEWQKRRPPLTGSP